MGDVLFLDGSTSEWVAGDAGFGNKVRCIVMLQEIIGKNKSNMLNCL